MRLKLFIVLGILILGGFVYGYFWVQQTNTLRNEAEIAVERADKYDLLHKAIEEERARCENFISQQEGDFGSFEYCKKFIDWANGLQ